MATSIWRRWLNRLMNNHRTPPYRKAKRPTTRLRLQVEELESRVVPAGFTAGDIVVLDVLTANTDNDTASVLAFNPTSGLLDTTVAINGTTGPDALRFDPGSGKTGFLSDTNDGTLLVLNGYNTTNSSSSLALNTILTRGVGTLDASTNFTLQTTYTGTSGNDARDATSTDDANWYIDDKDGLYTNGSAPPPTLSTNILDAKSFGGTVYVSSASSPNVAVSTLSSPTATTLTALPGLPVDTNLHDFYLISSGSNGSTYDVLYTLDETSKTVGAINKFALIDGTWTAEGSYTTNFGGDGLAVARNGNGGAFLYVTTGSGGTAKNSLMLLTDTSAWDAPIAINTASNVTLATAATGNTFMGVAFAPDAAITTTTAVTTPSGNTGNPVTLTATVTVAVGTPPPNSGAVEFFSGSTLLGTATSPTTNMNVATFTFTGTVAVGMYPNIQADYISGGGGYTNSDSVAANGPTLTVSAPPTVQMNTANIGTNAASLTIMGSNFSSNLANDSVSFNLGAVGTVTNETPTSLTVSFTGAGDVDPTTGNLTAVVTVSGLNSGSPVQVATVVNPPTVQQNTGNLADTATTFTIMGTGFDSTTFANNTVVFNLGAVGTVTGATSTQLAVSLTSEPSTGSLTAVVTTDGVSSGAPVQIYTVTPTQFQVGNVAVLELGAKSDNTTGSILELNSSTANQANPVQTIAVPELGFSDSGTSSFLSDTNDGTELVLAAYDANASTEVSETIIGASWSNGVATITADNSFAVGNTVTISGITPSAYDGTFTISAIGTGANANLTFSYALSPDPGTATQFANATATSLTTDLSYDVANGARAVGVLTAGGAYIPETTYTEIAAGDQTRSATSLDDTNFLITDHQGTYTNGDSGNWIDFNVLNARSFGGVLYISSDSPAPPEQIGPEGDSSGVVGPLSSVMTLASPTSIIANGMPGVPVDPNLQDFYLIQSGSNGNTYDILYTLDQNPTKAGAATINKFSLVGGTWVANGSYSLAGNATGMIAEKNPSGSGANLFVLTSAQAQGNTLVELTDPTGWVSSTTPTNGFTLTNQTTLYTATGTNVLKGIAFVPTAATAPSGTDLTVSLSGAARGYTGQNYIYTLTAANIGTVNATGDVTVQFTLPSATMSVRSISAPGFTVNQSLNAQNEDVITLSNGTVDTSSPVTLTVTVEDSAAETVIAVPGAAGITPGTTPSPNTVTTTFTPALAISDIPIAPVVNSTFTLPLASFSDLNTPGTMTAMINWGDGISTPDITSGTISYLTENEPVNPQAVAPSQTYTLYVVTGTHMYTSTGTYNVTVTINDGAGDSGSVMETASVGEPQLAITAVPLDAENETQFTNQTVATFTDPGIPGLGAPSSPNFLASINWGDGTASNPDITTGTLTYNSGVFSVQGTHTYEAPGSYPVTVTVTPQTIAVSLIDSSDPNQLTKAPSAEFIEQLNPNVDNPVLVNTLGLPTVATTGGNFALTVSAGSPSESRLHLSTNGGFLTLGGYNSTVSGTSDQSYLDPPNSGQPLVQVQRVIGVINGEGVVNTTTGVTDADYVDNFRGAIMVNNPDGTSSIYTYGSGDNLYGMNEDPTGFIHYVASGDVEVGDTTSTIITNVNYDTNGIEIFNNTMYDSIRSPKTDTLVTGIYEVGGTPTSGNAPGTLPTSPNALSTLMIETPQSNPFDALDSGKTTGPYDFFMADLPGNSNVINGVNVAYVADGVNGIERFDYDEIGAQTAPQWNFSYYITQTGSFSSAQNPGVTIPTATALSATVANGSAAVTVGNTTGLIVGELVTGAGIAPGTTITKISGTTLTLSNTYSGTSTSEPLTFGDDGQIFTSATYSPTNLPTVDTSYAGGITGLTGEVVNGQVVLYGVTGGVGYGNIKNGVPANSVIEVTDTGANSGFTTLATAGSDAEYRGVALSPWASVTSQAQVVESLSAQTKIKQALGYNFLTHVWSEAVTITNTGTTAISGPLQVWLTTETGASPTTQPAGKTTTGVSYYTVNPPGGTLGVGQSVSITFTFSSAPFSFTPQVWGEDL